MAGADTKQQLLVKVHDCTKISYEFMSEKCALGEGGLSKKTFKCYIKKTKTPKKQSLGCYHKPVLIIVTTHVAELDSGLPAGQGRRSGQRPVGSESVLA